MELSKEVFDSIVELGRKSKEPQPFASGNPRELLYNVGGLAVVRKIEPDLRGHYVHTLDDLARAATGSHAVAPVIYHDHDRVILLLDDGDRRDQVRCLLLATQPLQFLQQLEAEPARACFQAKELWRFFKTLFADCGLEVAFVRNLQKLKWKSGEETRQEFGQGRESIGRDVEAELTADVQFPDVVLLDLRLYENEGEDETWPVRCSFEADALEQRIHFAPFPGELSRALQSHQGSIRRSLAEKLPKIPLYYGQP